MYDARLRGREAGAAAEHQATHGQPITRDALRARLGISNQLASGLLRQIRGQEDTAPAALRRRPRPHGVSAVASAGVSAGVLETPTETPGPHPADTAGQRQIKHTATGPGS